VILKPSFHQGFARSAGESAFPERWRGLVHDFSPAMGIQGGELKDFSGNLAHGTFSGMDPATDWVTGSKGHALSFDGVNDHVSTAAGSIPGSASFSVMAWVLVPGSKQTDWRTIMEFRRSATNWWGLYESDPGISWRFRWTEGGGTDTQLDHQTGFSVDTWYRVGGTYNSATTTGRCYLNGFIDNENTSATNPVVATSGFLRIGSNQDGNESMKAHIANTRVYNRALTEREMLDDYLDSAAIFRLKRRQFGFVPAAGGADVRRHIIPAYMRMMNA